MAYDPHSEGSIVRTDWTIDGVNRDFDLSYTPVNWSVFAFVNRTHARITSVSGSTVRLAVAPQLTSSGPDQVDFQFVTSDSGTPEMPTGYTEESSDDTLTGSVDGSNAIFTLSSTPDAWNVFAFINGFWVPCTVSGSAVTLSVVPDTGDLVTIRYTVGGNFQAYWKGGYFGIETPRATKFFRNGRLIVSGSGFQVKHYLVDHDAHPFSNPLEVSFADLSRNKYTVNQKGVLHQTYISFPSVDGPADVLQQSDTYYPLSQRN
jgi:hypothetical protein